MNRNLLYDGSVMVLANFPIFCISDSFKKTFKSEFSIEELNIYIIPYMYMQNFLQTFYIYSTSFC